MVWLEIAHKAGPTMIRELALRLYSTPLESFREAVSNGLDEQEQNPKPKVEIICSSQEVVFEDWGNGIKDVNLFVTYGQDSKLARGGETIGEKGIGKLALLRLKDTVEFRTNNGKYGIDIMMRLDGNGYENGALNEFLNHKGTRLVISKPDIVPPTDELADYLRKVFGLRIAKGAEIVLNGATLKSKVDPEEARLFRIEGGFDVTGNLQHDDAGKGSVDLYVKHVLVKSVLVEPGRCVKGWVNCNALEPTTSRADVLIDSPYLSFADNLKQYVAQRFPKKEEELNPAQIRLANQVSRLLEDYLKHMNIMPRGDLPFGQGKEPSHIAPRSKGIPRKTREPRMPRKPTKEEEEHIKKVLNTTNPILRTRKTDYGLIEAWSPDGNDKDPIYFGSPNFVVNNTTNDIYIFASKDKFTLGPKWLRIMPWLARMGVKMNPDYKKWDSEKINAEIDKAVRFWLKSKEMT